MAQYAPEFLASLKHRYEKTDQPMIELAREFGIGITTLQVLVDKQGWEKRSQRLRGLPRAALLEREADALAAAASSEESVSAEIGDRVDRIEPPTPALSPPLVSLAGGGEPMAVPSGAEPSPVERLEALVMQEIADLESARDLRGGKRVSGAGAERTAQALASLTRTLQTIRRMRGAPDALDEPERTPQNIDERRLLLAAKIREFLRSRQEAQADAGEADAAR